MTFCPNCKYEYRDGIPICPDCDMPLVSELAEDTHPNDVEFVPLPDLPGRIYADMVNGALEAKNIPCYIRSDGVMDTYGITGTGPVSRGFRIFVPQDRLEECLEIQHAMMDHI